MIARCSLCLLLLLLLSTPANVRADDTTSSTAAAARTYSNPIIDRIGPADPHVIRHEGRYYLYPTLDGIGYDVFVSDDLVHWEQKEKCFTDPRGGAWAPDVFHHRRGDGKFYLYYTLNAERVRNASKVIGVAVADGPLGPFTDKGVLASPAIDAHLFEDDDGALYLYYVDLADGFKIMVQRMDGPLKKSGEPREVIRPTADWEQKKGAVTEGPWMLKRGGVYYLMYSGSGADGPDYAIGYATSKSPLGPFEKHPGNPIAHRGNGVFGPGHHCVIAGPDERLWMVYHQQNSEKTGWERFLALDPLWFDKDGVIHTRTTRGTEEPLSAQEPAGTLPALTWTPVFEGVSRSGFTLTSPRPVRAFALKIALKTPGLEFLATPANGEREGETDARFTSTFLRTNGLQAAINASPFSPVVNAEGGPEDISGLHVSRGETVSPAPKDGLPALILTKDNQARIEPNPAARAGDAWNAVCGFNIVLKGGEVVAGKTDLHPRTAAGISADGNTLVWLVVDGRQKEYSGGAKTEELGTWLKSMGCSEGINLDGGGTSTLVLQGADGPQILNRPIHLGIPGKERPSGSHLGVRAKPLAKADPPPASAATPASPD